MFISSDGIAGLQVSIVIVDDDSSFDIIIGKTTGAGGTKRAFTITDDLVLLLPSKGISSENNRPYWNKIVNNEMAASEFLTSINLLNPRHKRVIVHFPQHDISYHTYLSNSFEGLKRSGIYVLDLKMATQFPAIFYDVEANLFDMKNWESIFPDLIYDIYLLYKYQLDHSGDSVSLAAVKSDDINLVSPYKIRYFGFDFPYGVKGVERKWDKDNSLNLLEFLSYSQLIERAAEWVLFTELDRRGEEVFSLPDEYEQLTRDIRKYFQPILTELFHK